jgi:fructose/tagatose bisphosphate aldolase
MDFQEEPKAGKVHNPCPLVVVFESPTDSYSESHTKQADNRRYMEPAQGQMHEQLQEQMQEQKPNWQAVATNSQEEGIS